MHESVAGPNMSRFNDVEAANDRMDLLNAARCRVAAAFCRYMSARNDMGGEDVCIVLPNQRNRGDRSSCAPFRITVLPAGRGQTTQGAGGGCPRLLARPAAA